MCIRDSDYTAASWKAFAAALASAEKVYADENASQKDVDDATAALNKAQAALVKVDGLSLIHILSGQRLLAAQPGQPEWLREIRNDQCHCGRPE